MPNDYPDDRDRDDYGRYERRDRDDRGDRRRGRRDDSPEAEPKQTSVLGVFALIQGIGSLFGSFIPCVGVFAIGGGAFGLLLGVIAWIVAKKSGRHGTGIPITSVVLNVCAMLIGGGWLLFLFAIKDRNVPVDDGTTIAITAPELDKEYDDNELAADKKYKGKMLAVTGKVQRITRDDKPGKITVELTGTPASTVDCHFDRSKQAELDKLQVGEEVTIRGGCKGKVRDFVTLENCSLVREQDQKPDPQKPDPKAPAGPPIAITAAELEKEYDENVIGADTKYKGKTLEVTGKFLRLTRDKPGKATVELEADPGSEIECDFNADAQAPLGKLATGDMLVIRGICRGRVDGVVTLSTCTLVKKLDKPSAGPPIIVTMETLHKAYEGNSVAADAKYKGKYLEVTGTVLKVNQNRPGKITIELGTEERLMLLCDFPAKEAKAQLEKVEVGEKLVIRGTCRGNGDGILILEDCILPKK